MYQLGEISNRDLALLYSYRILRSPADFLSSVYSQGEPLTASIQKGEPTDLLTDSGESIYSYKLDVELDSSKIPYLEFDAASDKDREKTAMLLYLDGDTLYSLCAEFDEPVYVNIYQVESLEQIKAAIDDYMQVLGELDITALRQALDERKNKPAGLPTVVGSENNLVEFTEVDGKKIMKDSHYTITSALDGQTLVNPSQELLSILPRKLRHSINIQVTDRNTRYLNRFSGFSINIQGNGNWVLEDIESGVDFISGSGTVKVRNCELIHFRNSIIANRTNAYTCDKLIVHRSLIVVNQGKINDVVLTGGSTLIDIPILSAIEILDKRIEHISLIGAGCYVYSWSESIPVSAADIHGLAWYYSILHKSTALYIAGRRIDEVSGEHDAELHPKDIVEYDVDNIHIHLGGD